MARHKIGLAISKQLKADKRNQTWLAEELGVSRSAVTKWLAEDGNRISADDLVRICDKVRADKIVFFELAQDVWPKYAFEYDEKLQEFNEQPQSDVEEDVSLVKFPDLPDLKSKTCPIYYELKLGKEEIIKDPTDRRERPIYEFPMWKERSEDWRKHFTETPAHTLLQQWSQQAGFHPIVGEPGGGKSTLLRSWAHKLLEMSTPTKQYLPLLVPLREVDETGLEGFFEKQGFDVKPYLEGKTVEGVQPVWLFDGLDELPKKYKATWTKIIKAQKQHPVLLTCRTALWDSDHRVNFGEPHYLMGMYLKEQKNFLLTLADEWREGERYENGFEGADEIWIVELLSNLQSQPSLKQLAGSPLLLTLIARTNKPNNIDLPAKRVAFYQNAFRELLKQREDDEVNVWIFIEPLCKLAYAISKDELRAEFNESDFEKYTSNLSNEQIKTLKKSNILRFNDEANCQWLHQTFQEWLLAEYLYENSGLLASTLRYWKNPQYLEVLTLLWGLSDENQRIETALFLINEGCKNCSTDIRQSRSGLKTLLTFISRSDNVLNTELQVLIEEIVTTSVYRKQAVAISSTTPTKILSMLANDTDRNVRGNVALNPNTSDTVLRSLADDDIVFVKANVASNNNTPADVLSLLSKDEHKFIRWRVAGNNNTNQSTLEYLVNDSYKSVLIALANNKNSSKQILNKLANDSDDIVRREVAKNTLIDIEALQELSKDPDVDVRVEVAKNEMASLDVLKALTQDAETIVRCTLAERHILNGEIVDLLLKDNNELVRIIVRVNTDRGLDISFLVKHENSDIRYWISKYPNLTNESLSDLLLDPDVNIRYRVAEHPNTDKQGLTILAKDDVSSIRQRVAANINTDKQVLSQLAIDESPSVEFTVAMNPNTPEDILNKLGNGLLSGSVASNLSTSNTTLDNG